MKITFPHLGNTYISVKALLDDLNIDYVIPPFTNKETLELGTRYVPEMACFPLKITVGNLIQAINAGQADTVLMAGGCGPCRFGYYCEMQREILKDIGLDVNFIVIEPPGCRTADLNKQLDQIVQMIRKKPKGVLNAARRAIQVVKKVDQLELMTFKTRAREIEKGDTDRIYDNFRKEALTVNGSESTLKLIERTINELETIKINPDAKPLKIGIVGEIYTNIDSFASFDLQRKLGLMGVEVARRVTISDWLIEDVIKKGLRLPRNQDDIKEARPYLGKMIGGHARETIGHTVLYAKNGYDGVIQTFPLTCMPEIVAKTMLTQVEKDYDIPVLTLIMDEMTGDAGYMTRLEAFIDLLNKRREEYQHERKALFTWN
jgi:predicted nucleotide-binding protein (sugar kinase/HSP70/actin superfamily)